jgi:hypothetical protein
VPFVKRKVPSEEIRETVPPTPINTERPPLPSLLFQSEQLTDSMANITPSPTRVALVPLSEQEEYRVRTQTPSFPNSFLHDLHGQIDALAAQIDAFREERGTLLRVVRADLRPGYQNAQRTVSSGRARISPTHLSSSPEPGPDMEDMLSPFHGYGMPLRRGFIDVGVQAQPLPDSTIVRARSLIPPH